MDPPTSLEDVLGRIPLFPKLASAMGKVFRVTASRGHRSDKPLTGGDDTCAKPENRVALFCYLTGLMDRRLRGSEIMYLLGITGTAKAVLFHSLFYVYARNFADPNVWGILWAIPSEPPPPPQIISASLSSTWCGNILFLVSHRRNSRPW